MSLVLLEDLLSGHDFVNLGVYLLLLIPIEDRVHSIKLVVDNEEITSILL